MTAALRVKSPGGGWVESVLTVATHLFLLCDFLSLWDFLAAAIDFLFPSVGTIWKDFPLLTATRFPSGLALCQAILPLWRGRTAARVGLTETSILLGNLVQLARFALPNFC